MLAVIVWYLVVAPPSGIFYGGIERDVSAPVGDWEIEGKFESLYDCRDEALNFDRSTKYDADRLKPEYQYWYAVSSGYGCIAEDDYRLAKSARNRRLRTEKQTR